MRELNELEFTAVVGGGDDGGQCSAGAFGDAAKEGAEEGAKDAAQEPHLGPREALGAGLLGAALGALSFTAVQGINCINSQIGTSNSQRPPGPQPAPAENTPAPASSSLISA